MTAKQPPRIPSDNPCWECELRPIEVWPWCDECFVLLWIADDVQRVLREMRDAARGS